MIKLFWSCFIIMLALSGCGWDGTPTRNNDFIPLTSIEITSVYQTIAAKTSTKLTVTGNFSGLFTRDITDQATWSTNAATVADFANAGVPSRVTGLTPGSAVLTATVGGVSSTFNLTVSNATITTVTVTPAAPSISKGLSTQFTASGTFTDSTGSTTTQDLTFDATWASTAPTVASVSDAVASKGLVQTLTEGTSTISATFDGVPGSTLLTVTAPALQSIAVSTTNSSVLSLSGATFKATGSYSDGSTADITALATWNSSNTAVATIATGGAAKTLAQGTTTISASLDGISGTSSLKVTGGKLTGITLSAANITMVNGNMTLVKDIAVRMTATGTFDNGSSRDITGAVEWSTGSSTIATVTTPGGNLAWLTPLASNSTTVSAKSGTLTATANLTVTAPTLQSITISPGSINLAVGTSAPLTVTGTFSNGTSTTTQDVTFSSTWSSNTAAASVGNIGLAKGVVSGDSAGSATISASYGGLTITAPVTVETRTLQSLALNAAVTFSVAAGNQVAFTATANYSNNTSQNVTEDTVWTIDKPGVAILADNVNQPGQAVGVDSGSAILTASFGGKTQTLTVTVP